MRRLLDGGGGGAGERIQHIYSTKIFQLKFKIEYFSLKAENNVRVTAKN